MLRVLNIFAVLGSKVNDLNSQFPVPFVFL